MDKIKVWEKHPLEVWVKKTVKYDDKLEEQYELRNDDESNNINNLIKLFHLNEPSILEAINQRYFEDIIYTYTGEILIAVNPFKSLTIYDNDKMIEYRNNSDIENEPHIYQLSNKVYNEKNIDHSILVSGESGAGKTQTTKYIMSFLANTAKINIECNGIEKKIIQSNPILEAFGNSKTRRNDNSSRFGKFIQLKMDYDKLKGGEIKTYLLEKVRLVSPPVGERNFHIFYQLLSGASHSTIKKLYLERNPKKYNILNITECFNRNDGISDVSEFSITKKAMIDMGINEQFIENIFMIISSLLLINNYEKNESLNDDFWVNPSKLLGINSQLLKSVCTTRRIKTPSESYIIELNENEIVESIKSLSRAIYDKLFDWLVEKINCKINNKSNNFIGILDIFGFEVFDYNSFEQLCINYTNEHLQKIFTEHTIKSEQEYYSDENIDWSAVDYPDNSDVLALIGGNKSIVSFLDEQCLFPNGSNESFYEQLTKYKCTDENSNLIYASKMNKADKKFVLNHYAGGVLYSTDSFIQKNKDIGNKDLNRIILDSENIVLNKFIQDESSKDSKITRTILKKFKIQLNELILLISKTKPHFVRCIKPNDENTHSNFRRKRVVEQLRYSGILSAVKVASSGYPIKIKKNELENEIWMLLENNNLIDFLSAIGKWGNDYQIGKTTVFLKYEIYQDIHKLKNKFLSKNVAIFSGFCKMKLIRNYYINILESIRILANKINRILEYNRYNFVRNNIIVIQSNVKRNIFLKKYKYLILETKSSIIKSYIKTKLTYYSFKNGRISVVLLQAYFRKNYTLSKKGKKSIDELEVQNKVLMEEINESKENLEKMQRESIKIILKAKLKDARMLEQIRDENSEMADKINSLSKMLEDSRTRERIYKRNTSQFNDHNNCNVM
jgi:myosin heavy subunit